jgi:hypothetical protein
LLRDIGNIMDFDWEIYKFYINMHTNIFMASKSIDGYRNHIQMLLRNKSQVPLYYTPLVPETNTVLKEDTPFNVNLRLLGHAMAIRFGLDPDPEFLHSTFQIRDECSIRLLPEVVSMILAFGHKDTSTIRVFLLQLEKSLSHVCRALGCSSIEQATREPAKPNSALIVNSKPEGFTAMRRCSEHIYLGLKKCGFGITEIHPQPNSGIQDLVINAPHRFKVVVFVDIQASASAFVLPTMRLGDVQVGCTGNPWTSGYKCMDYFLSADWDSQENYQEKLVGVGPLGATATPCSAQLDLQRAHEKSKVMIPCPSFKCSVEFLELLGEIEQRVGDVQWVWFHCIRQPLVIQEKIEKYLTNVEYVEISDPERYYKTLPTVKCVVAPYPFGVFNVNVDCIRAKTPCFVLADRDSNYPTRIGAELNKVAGLDKYNASSKNEFVDKVSEYIKGPGEASDPDWEAVEKANQLLVEKTAEFFAQFRED